MNLGFAYLGSVEASVEQFDCGVLELNDFIQREATRFVNQGLSAVKLLLDTNAGRIAGFYAISPLCVQLRFLSAKQREQYSVPFPIPAWLIGRLAVDADYQNQSLGGALLQDAIDNIKKRAQNGAGALIIVDAKNKKVKRFYEKYGFHPLDSCGGMKLATPISFSNCQ